MFDPEKIREDFPILRRTVNGKPLVYLDNAATAQKPRAVMEAMDRLMSESNANIHRGIHRLSNESTELYEGAREAVREFVGAGSTEEIVFTSGATAGINTVAYSFAEKFFEPGDNIILSVVEHHSNIVPWQLVCGRKQVEIRVLPCDDDGRLMIEQLEGMIDGRTKIVAVSAASNVLGVFNEVRAVADTAHRHGVPVLVDGCQYAVHRRVDVRELDCDFFVFSGHKLYGPTGIGVLYGRRELLEEMPPFMGGGDMVARVSFEGTTYADLPLKFEAGTANYIGAVGLAGAIRYVQSLDRDAAAEHEKALAQYAARELSAMPGVRVYGNSPGKCSIVSFSAQGVHPSDIGLILDKMGIAVRTGTHCAEPLMTRYGLTGMCRASFAFYNTMDEAKAFVAGVERALGMLR